MSDAIIKYIEKKIEIKEADQRTAFLLGSKNVLIDETLEKGRKELIKALSLNESITYLKIQLEVVKREERKK